MTYFLGARRNDETCENCHWFIYPIQLKTDKKTKVMGGKKLSIAWCGNKESDHYMHYIGKMHPSCLNHKEKVETKDEKENTV